MRHPKRLSAGEGKAHFLWGVDYDFTNYHFRKALELLFLKYCQRGVIQCLFEIPWLVIQL